jgi:hypothetical protein
MTYAEKLAARKVARAAKRAEYIIHRTNAHAGVEGVAVCGAREFITPGKHKFVQAAAMVTCESCKSHRKRAIPFSVPR